MSGFGPPRFPHRPRGPFPFDPRFPPLNPPPRSLSPGFRPRYQENEYFRHRGRSGPRERFPTPHRHDRPSFGNRGRGQGYYGSKSFKRSSDQGRAIEAYYKHSMVEDPWKELEENLRKQNQKQEKHDGS
ncbi:uncharacterized protein LOC116291537 [Actinia tenebrosa]|uniref:Uncharacterized protein LOC116291537 n=1 Tax=Actinia tenebrosa TaxID=6105 RepID=A0A6P8HPI5_ACTTE|nr:uncharacterized protein LOC116291537 [Actinia tenebrosa]